MVDNPARGSTLLVVLALIVPAVVLLFWRQAARKRSTPLGNFLEALRNRPGLSVVPGFLRPIDTEAIARELRVDAKAAENGSAELPDAKAQQPDAPEQEITQRIIGVWSWQGEEFLNQLRAYATRLAEYSIHSEYERLRLKGHAALKKLQGAGIRAPAELGPLKEAYLAAHQELTDFRSRHKLNRPARDKPRRWTAFGLMVVLVAVESVVNGLFFAEGASRGILGGIGMAIGISAVNVICAFLLGLGPARCVNYRHFFIPGAAVLLTLTGLALLVGLHCFAVHFREATIAVGQAQAFSTAIDTLLRTPWNITRYESLYLLALGLLFGLAAFWKGCTFEDPYPFYGPMHRRAVVAREEYSDHHADLFDELEEIKDETVNELESSIRQIPVFPQHAEAIRSERSSLIERFRAYETAIESAANQLLARYRAANRKARKTSPPAYFEEAWKLPSRFTESAKAAELIVSASEPPTPLEPILADFRNLSQQILDEYTKLIKQYPHPTEMHRE